jgi:hypothetical protein
MIKRIKHAVFILTCFLMAWNVSGQTERNMQEYLTQKFQKYIERVPWEEVFVHSDREEYIAGEDLWFNLYLIDRHTFKSSNNSRIVYFELLNSENRPVAQKRILVENGSGPGQVKLSDTLSSGTYTIRAYTNWMKNFLPYNFFIKEINIYNAINDSQFRVKGNLSLIPLENKGYQGNRSVENPGLKLRVDRRDPGVLKLTVHADEKYLSVNNVRFYLFVQTHGIIDHVSAETLTGSSAEITVPVKSLTPGINQITVFDSNGKPVCESYGYTPATDKKSILVQAPEKCGNREKVVLDIDAGNSEVLVPGNTNLSVSVSPATGNDNLPDLNDYLIFGTEYRLHDWELPYPVNISGITPEMMDSVLLHLRNNWINWTAILSDTLPDYKFRFEKDFHFLPGRLMVAGQQSSPASGIVLLCTPGRQPGFQYAKADENGNFSFSLPIDGALKDIIVMPDETDKNLKIIPGPLFSDQYGQLAKTTETAAGSIPPWIPEWSANYQVEKIYGLSSEGNYPHLADPILKPVRFYGKPDVELILADYVSLPKMEEVFFEILPNVSLKKKNSVYKISITDRTNDVWYELSPSLFLDGVRINDASIIADLDPGIVERIDVVKEKYIIGKYAFPGIVNVVTKSGDFSTIPLPEYMIRLPYRVIELVMSFAHPDYSSPEKKISSIPDFRNTLYWNPSVVPGRDGKIRLEFWTSDITNDYIINIQGIAAGGKIITEKRILRVN